jgi:hypothetical protein
MTQMTTSKSAQSAPPGERDVLAKTERNNNGNPIYRLYRHTSLVNGARLRAEGENERALLLWTSFREDIVDIQTNCESLTTPHVTRYTADTVLTYITGEVQDVEVKSDRAAEEPAFEEKFEVLSEDFDAAGRNLQLIKGSDLPSLDHIANLKRLYIHKTALPPEENHLDHLKGLMQSQSDCGEKTFRELIDELAENLIPSAVIWYAIAHGLLTTDLDRYIDVNSILTWSNTYEN